MKGALFSFFTHSIARRLSAAFVLFVIPVIYVGAQLLAKQNDELTFSKLELSGTHFLRPALQIHSAFVEAASQNAVSRRPQADVDRFLKALNDEDGAHAKTIEATEFIRGVAASASELNAPGPKDSSQLKSYINSAQSLITEVAERSNLILDSELSTFYLMEVVGLRSAPLIEQINNYEVAKLNSEKTFADDGKELARQEGMLRALHSDFERSFNSAMKTGVQDQKMELLGRLEADVQVTIDRLIATKSIDDAQKNSRAARQSILRAALLANDQLAVLLSDRIERVSSGQRLALFGAGFLFVCCVILALTALVGGVVKPLDALTDAMKKVAGGELDVEPPFRDRRDEIGDMARALEVFRENAVARIQAEHAAAAKSEFLAVMSHEIRTPLNGVMGMTQALASSKLEASQRKMLEVVQECGETLLTLLNDILDMSKIEAGKLELESIPFAPERLLRTARDLFDERASQKGLQIITKIEEGGHIWRIGDPARLRQVIFNLLSNAIKFTEFGTVTLELASNDQGEMVIRVKDTGIGIPEDRLPVLFSKFTQADSSHTRVYGGTGLGLSIAKAIIEAMSGRIQVDSVLGEWSCFTITLPLETTQHRFEHPTSPAPAPAAPIYRELADDHEAEAMSERVRILVAEDNPTNRFVIQTLLEGIGIEPIFTENGQEALEAWQQSSFDVILMDMQMPVMDGLTAMREIRTIEAKKLMPRIPIVALTANAMGHQIQEQVNAGADSHAAKPIQLPALIAAIEDAIDRCDALNAGHVDFESDDQPLISPAASAA